MSETSRTFKFFTGQPIFGEPRTDASAFRSATKIIHPSGRASRWAHLSHAQRAIWRLSGVAVASGTTAAYLAHPLATEIGGGMVAAAGASYGVYWARREVRQREHTRKIVGPLAEALAKPLELSPLQVQRGLTVPLEYATAPGAEVVAPVPDGWHGERSTVESVIAARLGGEWSSTWRMLEAPFSVAFTRAPSPPSTVRFADVRDLIDATPEGQVFIGLGTAGQPIRINLRDATPHIGLSCGTGAGKSVLIRGVIAQVAARGGRVTIVDPKLRSLNCFEGVPMVTIHRFLEDQIQAIADFRARMESVYASGDVRGWGDDAESELTSNPEALLVLEEQNDFAAELRQWWAENKPKGAKGLPPTFTDIAKVLFKGRQANARILGVYQRLSVNAIGLTESRDQFGAKLLGRYSWQNFGSLVGTRPMPPSSDHPGRMLLVTGGRHRWVQTCFWTEQEAHDYALAGREETVSPVSSNVPRPCLSLVEGAQKTQDTGPAEPVMTLRDACTLGIIPLEYPAAMKARQRTGTLTSAGRIGNAEAYTEAALTAWYQRHYQPSAAG